MNFTMMHGSTNIKFCDVRHELPVWSDMPDQYIVYRTQIKEKYFTCNSILITFSICSVIYNTLTIFCVNNFKYIPGFSHLRNSV